jgi:hypothetical protein
MFPAREKHFRERGRLLKEELGARIGEGVLLYPPLPRPAPRHTKGLLEMICLSMDSAATSIWNVLELPVTQVPEQQLNRF